ncbi:MAG: hypothetical protein FWH01_04460 [Oscillospiraceae bacterium]|nr:hypothetical protein [Oscillospiraceae bacterium]
MSAARKKAFYKDNHRLSDRKDALVEFYNKQRPCYAIGYDTPDNYYRRFMRGEMVGKDTFSQRVLTEMPKFVQNKKEASEEQSEKTALKNDKRRVIGQMTECESS